MFLKFEELMDIRSGFILMGVLLVYMKVGLIEVY